MSEVAGCALRGTGGGSETGSSWSVMVSLNCSLSSLRGLYNVTQLLGGVQVMLISILIEN